MMPSHHELRSVLPMTGPTSMVAAAIIVCSYQDWRSHDCKARSDNHCETILQKCRASYQTDITPDLG